jgi:phosphoglycolate phosphatase
MTYPLAIFDFDGTLANSLPCFVEIMRQLSDQHGYRRIEDHELESLRTADTKQFLKHLGIPLWKLPLLVLQVRSAMTEVAHKVPLFPGIAEFLDRMTSAGIELAIVSSNSWENVRTVLGLENVAKFRYTECEASLFGKRPKLRKVLRQAGVPADRAIYIGDEVRDLEAAHAEGIAFGAVTWGHTPRDIFRPHYPQEVFESIESMASHLLGH